MASSQPLSPSSTENVIVEVSKVQPHNIDVQALKNPASSTSLGKGFPPCD